MNRSVMKHSIMKDQTENRQTGKSNESKRDETQHNERPVNRDNAGGGGGSKGKGKTVIVGDSIVKGLDQYKLSRASKQNIGVRCFPGATVQDMKDYIRPILRRNPDT